MIQNSKQTNNIQLQPVTSYQLQSKINFRTIQPYIKKYHLPSNQIHTTKYYWWNFIPKNLIQQFRKPPNLYFLIIGIFQILPYTSTTANIPSMYLPLGIIIVVTAIRDLYQDYHRSVSDYQQNNQLILQISPDGEQQIFSKQIRVGSVIKVKKDQFIPVDGIILGSKSRFAYVETKNLDGQTNLKRKYLALDSVNHKIQLANYSKIKVDCQQPHLNMNCFSGQLHFQRNIISLNINHLVLRGSILKNTDYIYVLALYTGSETKILMSMNKINIKVTGLETKMNQLILFIFLILILTSLIFALLKCFNSTNTNFINGYSKGIQFLVSLFCWILNTTNLVPISLLITLESVKILQARIIINDSKMRNQEFSTTVNNSNIIQDLGTIDCIASDKTGTLTKNNLKFKYISDGISIYQKYGQSLQQMISKALLFCHQIQINVQNEFEGISQDQICILQHLKLLKYEIIQKNSQILKYKNNKGQINIINILKIIDFTSQRKKQSIIYQQKQKIWIITKGADDQLHKITTQSQTKKNIQNQIQLFALSGFRTLVYAYKQMQQIQYFYWKDQYLKAQKLKNKDIIIKLQNQIQSNLKALCVTAIQDQLQDNVSATIKSIIQANIKFIIISGDKPETVLAIAKNLNLNISPLIATQNIYLPKYEDQKFLIFARCTPKQKQQIVSQIKGKVLAVGDGANDVSMLTKASVGVGVCGKQGKAAIQNADFGIPQFKYLKRLIFYYGSQIHRKNSILIRYNFYKNFLYTVPQFVFGFYNSFSGVYIYQSYLAQLFNLIFTALPIIIFALFDQHFVDYILEQNIKNTYKFSRQYFFFNNKSISLNILQGLITAVVIFVLCLYSDQNLNISPNNMSIFQISSIYYLVIIIISNFNVLFISKSANYLLILSIILSISVFFGVFHIICNLSEQLLKTYSEILNQKNGIIILLCLLYGLIIHGIFFFIDKKIQNIENGSQINKGKVFADLSSMNILRRQECRREQ